MCPPHEATCESAVSTIYKVMNKYLKRKYRELKLYIKNGWWGYSKLATMPSLARRNSADEEIRSIQNRCLNMPCASYCSTSRNLGICKAGLSRHFFFRF